MTSDSPIDSSKSKPDLLGLLLKQGIVSPAQVEIINYDLKSTQMSLQEIVVARGWVKEAQLKELAPWLDTLTPTDPSKNYEQNLREYYSLIQKIISNQAN
jgi:predicted AlkP superfamily phosphohydrolase/phosphomutase